MGWIEDIGQFVGDAGNWIDKNQGWLKPVVKFGTGALGQMNTSDAQSQYLEYLRQQEQQNYQNSVDATNAYNQQLQASQGAAAANRAAAMQTEANRQAAAKKGNKKSQQTYKELLALYAPFKDTATQLLPQMSQTYQNSLGMQNAMSQYLNQPGQVAKLDAAGPAWNVNVPLPESLKGR